VRRGDEKVSACAPLIGSPSDLPAGSSRNNRDYFYLLATEQSGGYDTKMTREQILGEANALSSRDRLLLAIDLWDSVESDAEFPPLSVDKTMELDRRLDSYLADPMVTFPADEVLDKLERELQ
jgi:putative addiction module component (TIGR02574 family)